MKAGNRSKLPGNQTEPFVLAFLLGLLGSFQQRPRCRTFMEIASLTIEPEHPAIHRNLGILLAQLGRNEEAIVHLRKVLQLVPNEPAARLIEHLVADAQAFAGGAAQFDDFTLLALRRLK